MRRRVPIIALLTAWVCANGALLDAVQVFAWARMFSQYVGTMDAGTALVRTFDSSRPCHLCRTVARAREQAKAQAPQSMERAAEKLVLALQSPGPLLFIMDVETWREPTSAKGPLRVDPVPVPPPRLLS